MASAKDIRFDQRNVTNTAYQEAYVSGSNLILRTNSTGSVVGVSTLEGVAIGTLTVQQILPMLPQSILVQVIVYLHLLHFLV